MQRIGTFAAAIGGFLVVACTVAAVAVFFVPAMSAIRDAMTLAILGGYAIAFAALTIAALAVFIDSFQLTWRGEKVPVQKLIRQFWVLLFLSTGALAENVFMAARMAGADPWLTVAIIVVSVGALLCAVALSMSYIRRARSPRSG
jgi:hypothetical protein